MQTLSHSQAHTQGPWTIQETCREYNGDLMIVAMEAGDNGVHVCQVTTNTKRNKINITEEQDANARLIAAAPTMREFIAKRASTGDVEAAALLENIDASR